MLRELQYRRVAIILAAFVLGALLMSTGLPAQGVAPEVSILSPEDGLATNQDTLPVEVAFGSSADPNGEGEPTGNVSTVVLKLDGVEVNSYDNPPAMKLGTHTFAVDVRSHADGPIAIEACAHQGSVMAGLVVCTDIVTVVVDRTPPEITATVTPGATCDIWHNSARAVTFEATDVGSGIASVTRNVVLTDDGAGQVVVGTPTDRAGNIASTSVTVDTDRTLVVSSAEEGGPGGLRRALSCAQPGEVIVFDPVEFPPNDPTTITLTRALPRLDKGSVAIDASNAGVILDGSEAGTVEYGLHLFSNSNTIRGLQIVGFSSKGIQLESGASYNIIGGDRGIGTGPMGQGNLISGNGESGIGLGGGGTSHNTIQGNYIGINLDGTAWGHPRDGIHHNGADHSVITDNVIGGNESAGIFLCCIADGHNTVTGNTIGTDPSGETGLGNHKGIIVDHTGYNVIGPGNSNAKTREGRQHVDRDAQFRYIARRVRRAQRQQQPTISVDTKKKELVGAFKNAGRTSPSIVGESSFGRIPGDVPCAVETRRRLG